MEAKTFDNRIQKHKQQDSNSFQEFTLDDIFSGKTLPKQKPSNHQFHSQERQQVKVQKTQNKNGKNYLGIQTQQQSQQDKFYPKSSKNNQINDNSNINSLQLSQQTSGQSQGPSNFQNFNSQNFSSRKHVQVIDNLYSKYRSQLEDNLQVMEHAFKQKPEEFQTVFRKNMHVFAQEEKLQQASKLSEVYKQQKSMINYQQEEQDKIQKLLKDYNIEIKDNAKLPYDQRMQKHCLTKNYFYKYKKQRVQILQDRPSIKTLEEPFHVKFRRLEKEKKDKQQLIEAKKLAILMGEYDQAQQIEVIDESIIDPEHLSKQEKLSMWIQKNQILKKEGIAKNLNERSETTTNFDNKNDTPKTANFDGVFGNKKFSLNSQSSYGGIGNFNYLQQSLISQQVNEKSQEIQPDTIAQDSTNISNNIKTNDSNINLKSFDQMHISHQKTNSLSVIPKDDKTFISLMRTDRPQSKKISINGRFNNISSANHLSTQRVHSKPKNNKIEVGEVEISMSKFQQNLQPLLKLNKSLNLNSFKNQRQAHYKSNHLPEMNTSHSMNSTFMKTPSHIKNLLGNNNLNASRFYSHHSRSKSDGLPINKSKNLQKMNQILAGKNLNTNESKEFIKEHKNRINISFKDKTPSLQDDNIKLLIQKYPTHSNIANVNEYLKNIKSKNLLKNSYSEQAVIDRQSKKLHKIMNLCKNIEDQQRKEQLDTEYKQLIQQVKHQEFTQTLSFIHELDSAHPDIIPLLYQYKVNDLNDNIVLAQEVAKEYQSGKADPKMTMINERNTKQLIKKGIMLR
eukprot:403340139